MYYINIGGKGRRKGRAQETGAYMEFLVMASLVVIGGFSRDIAIFTSLGVTFGYGNTGIHSDDYCCAGLLLAHRRVY